ncbi:hypothetical protein QL285_021933 [Trifolium repens]|nr:hypothetical protein QL285_021933 [Trifolium repens]
MDEVTRKRAGRDSVAHSSARRDKERERALAQPSKPKRTGGKMKEVSSTAENHPDPVPDHETTLETEHEVDVEEDDYAEAEVEENDMKEGEEEQEDDDEIGDGGDHEEEHEDEDEERTPSPPKKPKRRTERRKMPIMTKGYRVPPIDAPEGDTRVAQLI